MKQFKLMATAKKWYGSPCRTGITRFRNRVSSRKWTRNFYGDMTTIATANIWLRTGDRVKIIVGEFDAYTFEELFEKTKALPWETLLPMDAQFPVLW